MANVVLQRELEDYQNTLDQYGKDVRTYKKGVKTYNSALDKYNDSVNNYNSSFVGSAQGKAGVYQFVPRSAYLARKSGYGPSGFQSGTYALNLNDKNVKTVGYVSYDPNKNYSTMTLGGGFYAVREGDYRGMAKPGNFTMKAPVTPETPEAADATRAQVRKLTYGTTLVGGQEPDTVYSGGGKGLIEGVITKKAY